MDKEKFKAALKLMKESVMGAEHKFKEAKLKDGVTIIKYDGDMPAVGMPVMTITEQGELPLPDGDYEMEDGAVMTIVGGLISELKPGAAPEAEDPNATPPPADMGEKPVSGAQAKAIVESIVKETRFAEQIEELTKQVAEFKTIKENFASQKEASENEAAELKASVEKQNETIKGIFELVEKLAELPSDKPAEPTKRFDVHAFRKEFKADLDKYKKK